MLTPLPARLEILPEVQRRFWPELRFVSSQFVLYGGTAVALRLGHRSSLDFDFFSSASFEVDKLASVVPWLRGAEVLQSKCNTYTVVVDRQRPVKISFFGGLTLGRAGSPQRTGDDILAVASLLDLAATKVAVIQQRAEKRDYLDLEALLRSGVSLADALGAARALYGERFNPLISLKALCYFRDGDLPSLSEQTRRQLTDAAGAVKEIPKIMRASDSIAL